MRQNTRMRDAVPVEKRVAVSLWRLATVLSLIWTDDRTSKTYRG